MPRPARVARTSPGASPWPCAGAAASTSIPRARNAAARLPAAASGRVNSQVGSARAVVASRLVAGRRARPSSTMRTGERCSRPGRRQVSAGSSASAVPLPIMIASWVARSQWPRARAASPVSHWLMPLRVAMRPSSEVASLRVTSGRPARSLRKKPAFSASAAARMRPSWTATPAWRSCWMPWPSTRLSGHSVATTTRRTPA